MKRIILNLLLPIVLIGTVSAQTLEDLDQRRNKELKQSSYSTTRSRHKKSIDWDVDDDTWGIGYNYSKHFPLALNANYTTSYLSIGAELGVNMDKKKIIRSESETDDPIMYFSVAPGFYCKYFSINCGVGGLIASNSKSSTNTIGTEDTSVSWSIDSKGGKIGLLLKPSIVGYIPISDGNYITLNVGYLYMPKFKDLNGFSFGVGFQIEL